MIDNTVSFYHFIIEHSLKPDATALDATVGNGGDSLFICRLLQAQGRFYGFDIQAQAIEKAGNLLAQNNISCQVSLFCDSHDQLNDYLPQDAQLDLAVFNLGYLPGGDKSIVTQPKSTLSALSQVLERLAPGGLILIAAYTGHPGGQEECQAVSSFLAQLDQKIFNCAHFHFINQKNQPPQLYMAERKSDEPQ